MKNLELYKTLSDTGDFWPIKLSYNQAPLLEQLRTFDNSWQQYNPLKPMQDRLGLSITTLDGSLKQLPSLCSLAEYNKLNNTQHKESDFLLTTPVYENSTEIQKLVRHFPSGVGRCHFIRFGKNGYVPTHRDGLGFLAKYDFLDCFRLVSVFNVNDNNGYRLFLEDQQLKLETNRIYFINTLKRHSFISYEEGTYVLVMNIPITEKNTKSLY